MQAAPERGGSINLIGVGTEINGDLITGGDIRVDGIITGDVVCKAKLVVGEGGLITGNINCVSAEISGSVRGKIRVSEVLYLKSTSQIEGDVIASRFVVEGGAVFVGNCQTNTSLNLLNNGSGEHTTEEIKTLSIENA